MTTTPTLIPSSRGSTFYRWGVVGLLWAVCFLNYADRQAIYSVFPLLRHDLHLSDVQLGMLGSSFMWMYALAGPFAGWLTDRVSRKWIIVGALVFWSGCTVATALVSSYRWLLVVRALGGLGEAFYFPASLSLLGDYHGAGTRSRAMAMHQSAVYVGTVAGGALSGMIAERAGWQQSFVIFGAAGLVLGLVLCVALCEAVRVAGPGASVSLSGVASLARNRWAIALTCVFFGANFVAAVFLTWLPAYMHDAMHLSLGASGLNATLYLQGASVAGVLLGGFLADRLAKRFAGGRMLSQAMGLLAGAPLLFAVGMSRTVSPLVIALAGFGLCKGVYDSNIWASLYDTIEAKQRGLAAGLMNSIAWVGGGLAPVAIALASRRMSMGHAIARTAVIYLLLGTAMTVLARRFRAGVATS
jgi:MFS family permease